MKQWMGMTLAGTLALTACVTINVYFPAAEAREAAREFVEQVIDEKTPQTTPSNDAGSDGGGMAWQQLRQRIDPLSLLGIGTAHAQAAPDITIKTPAIQAIQARMKQRFDSTLRAGFDSGALGFTEDGLITVRDASKLALRDRVPVNTAVADDNRDRRAVYREVAVANGHPEWEARIREVFARQWVDSARSGWWYQQGGQWKQK